jgi:hypothetical protein
MKSYHRRVFFGTHAALGGAPWFGDQPKTLTREMDRNCSRSVDEWMRQQAIASGIRFFDPQAFASKLSEIIQRFRSAIQDAIDP